MKRTEDMTEQFKGSLWRDYNDHIFRMDKVTVADDGWFVCEGVMLHCSCGMDDMARAVGHNLLHEGQPYTTYAEPDDDWENGEIYGLSLMHNPQESRIP